LTNVARSRPSPTRCGGGEAGEVFVKSRQGPRSRFSIHFQKLPEALARGSRLLKRFPSK
jgi:hypothetical protein